MSRAGAARVEGGGRDGTSARAMASAGAERGMGAATWRGKERGGDGPNGTGTCERWQARERTRCGRCDVTGAGVDRGARAVRYSACAAVAPRAAVMDGTRGVIARGCARVHVGRRRGGPPATTTRKCSGTSVGSMRRGRSAADIEGETERISVNEALSIRQKYVYVRCRSVRSGHCSYA